MQPKVQEPAANRTESYIKRLHDLEESLIALKVFKIAWPFKPMNCIMVNPGQIKDDKVTILAHKVREKIESNLDSRKY